MEQLLIAGVVIGAAYLWSLRRHPYRDCRRCDGSKSHQDTAWPGAWGNCTACHGTGMRTRWGVRLLMPRLARAIRSGQHGRYY